VVLRVTKAEQEFVFEGIEVCRTRANPPAAAPVHPLLLAAAQPLQLTPTLCCTLHPPEPESTSEQGSRKSLLPCCPAALLPCCPAALLPALARMRCR
jgi:hypothetical protein